MPEPASVLADSATFRITSMELSDDPVAIEQDLTISAEITNGGEQTATRSIELYVNETKLRTATVTLKRGESGDVSFDVRAPGEEGEYRFTVSTDDDVACRTLTVTYGPPDEGEDEDSDTGSNDNPTNTEGNGDAGSDTADDDGTGFGVGGALTAVAGAGCLLYRLWRPER